MYFGREKWDLEAKVRSREEDMFGLSETQLLKILPPLISLLTLALVSFGLWRLRKRIISKLKDNVHISNDRGQVVLHAPPLKPYYKLFLGTKSFEQIKRRQESKLLYLEPIVEDALSMISSGRASGSEEEAVYFTAFYPKNPTVGTWHNLVLYMHTKSAIAEIQKDIDKYSDELAGLEDAPEPPNIKMRNRRTAWLTQGSRVTLLPRIEGITFNPPFQNMWWVEDFNRASLYFMGGPAVLNTTLSGEIAVHVGLMEIATLPITIRFAEARPLTDENVQMELEAVHTKMHRNIFPSYAKADGEVIESVLKALVATGDQLILDSLILRDSPEWPEVQQLLLRKAKNFQLFWSSNAVHAPEVQQELKNILNINGRSDTVKIRPVYWNVPMPNPPQELAHLNFKFVPAKINK